MYQLTFIEQLFLVDFYKALMLVSVVLFMCIKSSLLYLIYINRKKVSNKTSLILLSIPIVSYIVAEIGSFLFFSATNEVAHSIWRISWNIQPIQFYSQGLLVYSLVEPNYALDKKNANVFFLLFLFTLFPLLLLFINPSNHCILLRVLLDVFCKAGIVKCSFIKIFGHGFFIWSIYSSWKKMLSLTTVSHLLRLHLKTFFILASVIAIPDGISVISDIFQLKNYSLFRVLDLSSDALFTISLVFFIHRIYHLRFLNMTECVEAGPVSPLTDEQMLYIKEHLCEIKTVDDIAAMHSDFFNQLANIAPERIIFHVRNPEQRLATDAIASTIEQFIEEKSEIAATFFTEHALLVYDELAFTHFYEYSAARAELLKLLEEINAAVCIPLKHVDQLFGMIIITNNAQKEELLSKSVQLHMQLYGTFVTYALSRFIQLSYYTLLEKHTALSLELFQTKQKNTRFHETLMAILTSSATKKQGVLFYKNGVFSRINVIAEELLQINPNTHKGHPLTKALHELVRRVETYGVADSINEKNTAETNLSLQAFPSHKGEAFIIISPADITQLVSIEHALTQPTDADHVVFLQMTDAGIAISRTFPGQGNIMIKAKLQMIKTLLAKKTIFLDVHEDDIDTVLTLAKNVCSKTIVQTVDCMVLSASEITVALLGKQLFGSHETKLHHGLLYALDRTGIIHIANAHRLDVKTQELLVRFLKTGSFSLSNARRAKPAMSLSYSVLQ